MIPLYVGERGRVERSTGSARLGQLLLRAWTVPRTRAVPERPAARSREAGRRPGRSSFRTTTGRRASAAHPTAVGRTRARQRRRPDDRRRHATRVQGHRDAVWCFDFWLPATLAPAAVNGVARARAAPSAATRVTGSGSGNAAARGADRLDAGAATARPGVSGYEPRRCDGEVLPYWKSPRGPQRMLGTPSRSCRSSCCCCCSRSAATPRTLSSHAPAPARRRWAMRLALGAGRGASPASCSRRTRCWRWPARRSAPRLRHWGTAGCSRCSPLASAASRFVRDVRLDLRTMAFAMRWVSVCGLAFGAAPALQLARSTPSTRFAPAAHTPRAAACATRSMAVEVALAVTVLVAAGMFFRNFMATRDEDPGFAARACCSRLRPVRPPGDGRPRHALFAATLLER